MLSPIKVEQKEDEDKVTVTLEKNVLKGKAFEQYSERTEEKEILELDNLVKSIGYGSTQIDSEINFDHEKQIIRNQYGCVEKEGDSSKVEVGKYAVGWVKTGAKG